MLETVLDEMPRLRLDERPLEWQERVQFRGPRSLWVRHDAEVFLNGATIMTTPTARSVTIARDAGFVGVEVRTERLLQAPDEVREAAAAVRAGEVWSVNGLQLQLDGQGGLDRSRLASELLPRLDLAVSVAAGYLLVVPPRAAGVDLGRAITAMRDGLTIVSDAAARRCIRVAFEFLGFGDCPINSTALAAQVVAGLDDVELVLDSCHWHAAGSEDLDVFPVERIAMVHLNDAPAKPPRSIEDDDRLLPGDGVIALTTLVGALRAHGYAGPWSLETFNPAYWTVDPLTIATGGRSRLADLLEANPTDVSAS